MDCGLAKDVEDLLTSFRSFRCMIITKISGLTDNDDSMKDIKYSNADLNEKHIDNMMALSCGQAMRLVVVRGEEKLPVIIPEGGKVHDVFSAVANAIDEKIREEKEEYKTLVSRLDKRNAVAIARAFSSNPPPDRLNWRRFWRTHCLISNEVTLANRDIPLNKIPGLGNGVMLRFVRRNRKKK